MRLLLALSLGACALSADVEPLEQDDECSQPECALNALQSRGLKSEESCHDAVPGDACYKEIMWAKHTGIRQHHSWYPGLTSHSSIQDFQKIVQKHSRNCAMPCEHKAESACHTAVEGESCFKDIMWAKHTGIHQHASWYHGLTPSSSDAEFQAQIHASRPDKCPEPCAAAETPSKEEPATVAPLQPEPEPVIPPQIPILEPMPEETPEPVVPEVVPEVATPAPAPVQHIHHPAPAPPPYVDRYPQCPKMPQDVREACEQQAIQQEQREREERERAEQEAERQHAAETPLDVRQNEIIDEIGGVPTEGGIPEFDDPDR